MISERFVCSRDELLLLSALGVGSRPGRDLPRVFFFLLSKGALGCFVLSPSCHVPLSLPFVWGSRARYGYGTSVSDKEGRGDDQMRCSCLIRGHPRGGVPPFYPSLCRVRSVYEEGRCCTPGISAAPLPSSIAAQRFFLRLWAQVFKHEQMMMPCTSSRSLAAVMTAKSVRRCILPP